MLRRLELAPFTWPASIIKILRTATLHEDTISCIEVLVSEIITPPIDLQLEDPLLAYAPLLLVLPYGDDDEILLEPFIRRYLPALHDEPKFALRADQSRSIARVARTALLLLDRVDSERSSRLVTSLVEEIKHQRSRDAEAPESTRSPKKRKMAGPRPLTSAAGVLVNLLGHAFDDDESRSRWKVVQSL